MGNDCDSNDDCVNGKVCCCLQERCTCSCEPKLSDKDGKIVWVQLYNMMKTKSSPSEYVHGTESGSPAMIWLTIFFVVLVFALYFLSYQKVKLKEPSSSMLTALCKRLKLLLCSYSQNSTLIKVKFRAVDNSYLDKRPEPADLVEDKLQQPLPMREQITTPQVYDNIRVSNSIDGILGDHIIKYSYCKGATNVETVV